MHGHRPRGKASPEYIAWEGMKARCENSNSKDYPRYGGSGIKVCEQWGKSFIAFYSDMGKKPTPGHSLDRIRRNGTYGTGNVRWSTQREQQNNRKNNVRLELCGEIKTATEWARSVGISVQLLFYRLDKMHLSLEDALHRPVRGR